jgi:hypothetical protein
MKTTVIALALALGVTGLSAADKKVQIEGGKTMYEVETTVGGTVGKVETVTKGKTVTYEAVVEKNGKKTEVAVNAAGEPIKS